MATYLFDIDGTLVDSLPIYSQMMLDILREQRVAHGEDIIKIITPLGYRGTAAYFKALGMTMPEDEIVVRRYGVTYSVCGMMMMMVRWHHEGFQQSVEQMAQIALRLMNEPLLE